MNGIKGKVMILSGEISLYKLEQTIINLVKMENNIAGLSLADIEIVVGFALYIQLRDIIGSLDRERRTLVDIPCRVEFGLDDYYIGVRKIGGQNG